MRPMITSAGAGGGHLMDKQSLVSAVQELWNAWEIHFMILLSLSLQVFLFLFAGLRRRSSNRFLQTVLWLAYLSADSVAVFVLGHLAVRVREPGHELVALWAPFLLVHLGGQDSITAFAKQDNDLWRRHLLNLVIQACVAGYVVAEASWPDARLRTATVLMFLSGFVKYAERTWCLMHSDTQTLRQKSVAWQKSTLWRKLMYPWDGNYPWDGEMRVLLRTMEVKDKRNLILADRDKRNAILEDKYNQNLISEEVLNMMEKGSHSRSPYELSYEAYSIIADLIAVDAPINKGLNIAVAACGDLHRQLEGFLSRNSHHCAYEHVGEILEHCYRMLYTKYRYGPHIFLILPSTVIAASIALALFRAAVDKAGDQLHTSRSSSRADVTVTYALFVVAIALDVSSAAIISFRHLSFRFPCLANCIPRWPACCTKQWSQELHQYNIINTAGMLSIWQLFGKDLDSNKPIREDSTSIKEFILDTLLLSGTRKEWCIASTRGHVALHNWKMMHRHKQDQHYEEDANDHRHLSTTKMVTLKSLQDSDFPTSVLTLHIATDICYHFGGTSDSSDHDEAVVKKHKQMSTELSNYIMYLVFKRSVMLTTNSKIAHDNACDEVAKVLSQPPKINQVLKLPSERLPNRFSPFKRKVDRAIVMRLIKSVKVPEQQDSMGEIKNMRQESEQQQDPTIEIKNQESEEQQNSTIEIENQESTDVDDDNAGVDHIRKLRMNSKTLKSPVLPHAVAVAQELIGIKNEAERWEFIAKMWAEMLYYTAPRCGGDFHYEHLSTGGEFVTHVLLLMYYLGPFLPPPS